MDANEFRQRMSELPEPRTELEPPYWEFWRWQLWRLAQIDVPDNFTKWPCIYHTMLTEHWTQAILYEFSVVRDFLPVLSIEFSKAEYNNLIHQAYHIYQWQQVTGKQIKDLSTIVEFGGGYGAMALLCHRLGFKGRYVIYDLPEFSLLQQWYLSQFHPLANVEWNPKKYLKNIDLFIALYSSSEVKPESRYIPSSAKSYLFLYSGQWEEYDNVSYFQVFQPSVSEKVKNWQHIELRHLPDLQNFYSFGW